MIRYYQCSIYRSRPAYFIFWHLSRQDFIKNRSSVYPLMSGKTTSWGGWDRKTEALCNNTYIFQDKYPTLFTDGKHREKTWIVQFFVDYGDVSIWMEFARDVNYQVYCKVQWNARSYMAEIMPIRRKTLSNQRYYSTIYHATPHGL